MTRSTCFLLAHLLATGLVFSAPQLVPLPSGDGEALASARPVTLASADFDEDGMPDLIVGYAGEIGGMIVMHRGNVDALYPYAPEARRHRAEGTSGSGAFLPGPSVVALDSAADFLAAGDFNNDGHQDILAGARGGTRLLVIEGDGRGGLSHSADIVLGGALVALAVGDVNRPDGVPDVVAGLDGASGSSLAVFESPRGVVASTPEIVRLPAPPMNVTLGRLRGTPLVSILAAGGDNLFIVEGRDRRLLVDESGESEAAPLRLDRVSLPSSITSMAWGDFLEEATPREELAITTGDGTLAFLDLIDLNGTGILSDRVKERQLPAGATLWAARLSGRSTQDLLVFEPAEISARAVMGLDRTETIGTLESLEGLAYPDLTGRPLAVLPMRLNGDARPDLIVLREGAPAPTLALTSPQSVIVVNSNLDTVIVADGQCTLREAINNANANTDTTGGDCAAGSGLDTVSFAIGGGGAVATIAITGSALPALTDSVTIDGTTQGCAEPPCIELNGTTAGAGAIGLRLTAGGNTVRGLVINRFTSFGINATSAGNILEGNRIGTNVAGTLARPNLAAGIRLQGVGATSNTIGGVVAAARNLVSGQPANTQGNGIALVSGATSNVILGNYLGTDASGAADLGNYRGIQVLSSSFNTIGGTAAGARNVISGNTTGLEINSSQGIIVQGNLVGTAAGGGSALGNDFGSVLAAATSCTIGGTAAGSRNVISGNVNYGLRIFETASFGNNVSGNYIGTDVTGTSAVANGWEGISIWNSPSNTIGGTAPEARNVISGNDGTGVLIYLSGATTNVLLGNIIGLNAAGTGAVPNLDGVYVESAPSNTIGGTTAGARNVISGNTQDGIIFFLADATGNAVRGNYIGVDATGAVAIGNGWNAIEIQSAPSNTIGGTAPGAGNVLSASVTYNGVMIGQSNGTVVQGNLVGTDATGTIALGNQVGVRLALSQGCTIGGSTSAARNVISGNVRNGVELDGSSGNTLRGNYIGTDVTGMAALPNKQLGVLVSQSNNNVIGGTAAGAGNVISGNGAGGTFQGMLITTASTGSTIQGNLIGTDATGTAALGNAGNGIYLSEAHGSVVGGTVSGAGNVISGNVGNGVAIVLSDSVTVQGNFVGTDRGGSRALGNGGAGVRINNSNGAQIGGLVAGAGNVIGNNAREGVIVVGSSSDNPILGNAIAENGMLGIDLGESDGLTGNDPGDADAGPNQLQNFPTLIAARRSPAGDAEIDGTLDSTPGSAFRLEFFAGASCDGSGHGEGRRYLGSTNVTTDATGAAPFSITLAAPVVPGEAVAATATSAAGSTSEFSACAVASCSSVTSFPHVLAPADDDHFNWPLREDVRWVSGNLAQVGSYAILASGTSLDANALDTTADQPAVGTGFYYLVRLSICGSWQSVLGSEPGRDVILP